MVLGITFDGKHSWRDYGLILTSTLTPSPEIKKHEVDIPGADGMLDLSEVLGGIRYAQRTLTLTFAFTAGYWRRYSKNSEVANALHGRRMKVVLDDDPNYYYLGRVNFDSWVVDKSLGILSFTVTAEPYKYETLSTMDEWLWDTFSFEDGIIRNYRDMDIDGEQDIRIIGSHKRTVPVIISDADMTVAFQGKEYRIAAGRNKIYGIAIGPGEYVLKFKGKGKVSIEYRGGML